MLSMLWKWSSCLTCSVHTFYRWGNRGLDRAKQLLSSAVGMGILATEVIQRRRQGHLLEVRGGGKFSVLTITGACYWHLVGGGNGCQTSCDVWAPGITQNCSTNIVSDPGGQSLGWGKKKKLSSMYNDLSLELNFTFNPQILLHSWIHPAFYQTAATVSKEGSLCFRLFVCLVQNLPVLGEKKSLAEIVAECHLSDPRKTGQHRSACVAAVSAAIPRQDTRLGELHYVF